MKVRRGVTEEDLRLTETLIAQSYSHLKQSVIDAPTQAFQTVSQTVHEHPFAATGAAVVAGAALCGIVKMVASSASGEGTPLPSESTPKNTDPPDLMHELLILILPVAVPYVLEYMLKGNGEDQS